MIGFCTKLVDNWNHKRNPSPKPYRREHFRYIEKNNRDFLLIGETNFESPYEVKLEESMENIKNILGSQGISYRKTSSAFRIVCRSEKDIPELFFEIRIWKFLDRKIIDLRKIKGDIVSFLEIFEYTRTEFLKTYNIS